MKVIVCLYNAYGMAFNKRRQSRDRNVISDIVSSLDGKKLFLNSYSSHLFEKTGYKGLAVSSDFLDRCEDDGVAFVETRRLMKYKAKIDCIVAYFWNRDYPSDRKLDLFPEGPEWELTESVEFPGFSHETITRNTYVKRQKVLK